MRNRIVGIWILRVYGFIATISKHISIPSDDLIIIICEVREMVNTS